MISGPAKDIFGQAIELTQYIVEVQRKLHERPELSYQEYETGKFIAKQLEDIGLEVTEGVARTGVVGVLYGKRPGKTIALRADMDALPINEDSSAPKKSLQRGTMHACGHDAHMAMLLGAAKILTQNRQRMSGNVKFIFQPAEEMAPSGGAEEMISQGALMDPEVSCIFGLHVWPYLPSGEVGVKAGVIMASNDTFRIVIKGKGGHGAITNQVVNPIYLAAQIIIDAQKIVDQAVNSPSSACITIPVFKASNAYNILPDQAILEGSVRYHDSSLGPIIKQHLESAITSICESAGGTAELEYHYGYPPLVNEPNMTNLFLEVAEELLGKERVHSQISPSMASEDFARYLQIVPGCYFFLGTKNEGKGFVHPLHSPKFQIDEDILPIGTALLATISVNYLERL
jgi:amidohydrolase